jgi:DNA-binding HxlR family transcriptional regulator
VTRRSTTAIHLCSFSGGLDDLPRRKQGDIREVLLAMEANPRKRFSVFEATANLTIARTMTRLVHEGYIETDHKSIGYPWTKYKLTAKGREAAGLPPPPAPGAAPTGRAKGGHAAAAKMSPEQRQERARKGAAARWRRTE